MDSGGKLGSPKNDFKITTQAAIHKGATLPFAILMAPGPALGTLLPSRPVPISCPPGEFSFSVFWPQIVVDRYSANIFPELHSGNSLPNKMPCQKNIWPPLDAPQLAANHGLFYYYESPTAKLVRFHFGYRHGRD